MKCPICKKKDLKDLKNISGYYFCQNCILAWQKKFPKAEYKDDYYEAKSSIVAALFSPIQLLFYKIRESYINDSKKKLWIDVGAGAGEFLKTVNAKKRVGIEISKSGRFLMSKKGLESISNKDFLKSKKLNADVISFWHVLEHVDKPQDYLKAGYENLSKTGKIVIGVPNIDSLEFKYFGKYWFHLVPQFHLWHFSPKSLERMLKGQGFNIDSIDFWSPEHHLAGLIQSFINKTTGSDNFLHRFIKRDTDLKNIKSKDILGTIFWITLGLPIILVIWIVNSLLRRSGTFVVVASKN